MRRFLDNRLEQTEAAADSNPSPDEADGTAREDR